MRAALAACLLAACSSTASSGETCGDLPPCAGGTVCDRSAAPPGCIPADEDPDGDGFANADDLCPHLATTTQYDEDGDGIGDPCDPCPIEAPTDAPDADGDGVTGACDPEPDVPGDRILAFSGFRDLPDGWTIPAGWVIQGGEIVATAPGASPGILAIPIVGTNHLAIEASYRIDSTSTSGTPAITVVGRDRRPAGTTLLQCGAQQNAQIEEVQISTDVETNNTIGVGLFDPAALYRTGFLIDGGQDACAVVANATTQIAASARGGGGQLTEAGLDVANATARFQWVMVIGR